MDQSWVHVSTIGRQLWEVARESNRMLPESWPSPKIYWRICFPYLIETTEREVMLHALPKFWASRTHADSKYTCTSWLYTEASRTSPFQRACLLAAQAPHSGDWLLALPITACGLRLEDEAVRIAVVLRLGSELGSPHTCRSGSLVDATGTQWFGLFYGLYVVCLSVTLIYCG